MQDFINQILDLPQQRKIGILAALILAVLALDFFYFYSPYSDQISRLREDIEGARNERDKKKKLAANLPSLQQQIRDLDGMLKQAVAQLPDQKEVPSLLSSISTKARESGLEILIFRPRAENFQDFYAEIPVDIVVRGGVSCVAAFFYEGGRLDKVVELGRIKLKKPQMEESKVGVEGLTQASPLP